MTWLVGWRAGDDGFLAFGPDQERLPVYEVVGAIRNPDALYSTDLLFPSCLKFMPYAEPVVDLAETSETESERLERRIATADRVREEARDSTSIAFTSARFSGPNIWASALGAGGRRHARAAAVSASIAACTASISSTRRLAGGGASSPQSVTAVKASAANSCGSLEA